MGAVPPQDADVKTWTGYARSLASIGLPVMLIAPGTKQPLDMRTDKERAAGGRGGVHLATTDPATLKKYVERALADTPKKGHPAPVEGPLNWAVRVAHSGYVVADADTPEEVDALRTFLADHYGGVDKVPGPTVTTPGSVDKSHHGGGHWWFKLPDGADLDYSLLPSTLSIRPEGHSASFSLYLGDSYLLIPPSQRPEGRYHLVASDNPVPFPLWAHLSAAVVAGQTRLEKRKEYQERAAAGELGDLEAQVCSWSERTDWEELLAPHGWTRPGMVDSCGCEIWTAPGVHSSLKSATAHGTTCTQSHVDVLNPPLHIWTDNPGLELEDYVAKRGSKTVSKLNVFSLLDHGGDISAALRAAGISQDPTGRSFSPEELAAGASSESALAAAGVDMSNAVNTSGVEPVGQRAVDLPAMAVEEVYMDADGNAWTPPREPLDIEEVVQATNGLDMWEAWGVNPPSTPEEAQELRKAWPPLGSLSQYRDRPPTSYIVDGLLEDRGLLSVIGDSGVGKSAVVLDMAACIVAGKPWKGRDVIQSPVLYVAGEGVSGAVDRLHAWEREHQCYDLEENFHIVEEAVLLGGGANVWAFLAREIRRRGVRLVIFDTLARMSAGLEENSASDMGTAVRVFDRLKATTGAGVLYVHHTARGANHGRGTTALRGALDSELLVTDTLPDGKPFAVNESGVPVDGDGVPFPGKPLTVKVTKQKNGPDDEYTHVCLTARHDSVVVTDLEGNVDLTPFRNATGSSPVAQAGESMEETAARVADYVARYTSGEKWPTMADIARGVAPDRYHRGRSKTEWRAVLDLAVDKALAKGLIYAHGSRYSTEPPLD